MNARELAEKILRLHDAYTDAGIISRSIGLIEQYTRELATISAVQHPPGTVLVADENGRLIEQGILTTLTT